MASCIEAFGDRIEGAISATFYSIGTFVGNAPRKTIALAILLTVLMGGGFATWETENRGEKLWVPQDTTAESETDLYESYYASTSRFNSIIVQPKGDGANVLTKERLVEAMKLHTFIETEVAEITDSDAEHAEGDDKLYTYTELCVKAGGSCASKFDGICGCLVSSILKQWNYDMETLEADDNILQTLQGYGSKDEISAVLGNPVFDADGNIQEAEAFTLAYFLESRVIVKDGDEMDPINEGWEEQVFLEGAESVKDYDTIQVDYFAGRSFGDEFGGAISGDLALVQISYVIAFLFLGANLGNLKCGTGSRWTMSLGALVTVGLSTAAGFGLSSLVGLFFGPVHSLLPFILLGIGVDDAFVIVNAFNRERKTSRSSETNEILAVRSARALARSGASITVTSATDLVAFAISSSSALPALASFCAYAAICIFFLWLFASTFFTACLVLDERRQRDNRRECLCCLTRKQDLEEDEGDAFKEDFMSRYFRNYHAPAILSGVGKAVVFVVFLGLFGFGVYGALNLSVEDSQRSFIPADSYLNDYFEATDDYFPSQGIALEIVFEDSAQIYASRVELANLETRVSGLSEKSPYIAEPISNEVYKNVMKGLRDYLTANGSTGPAANITLGDDNWPTTEADFVTVLDAYVARGSDGSQYAPDVSLSDDGKLQAVKVELEYVRLVKKLRGEVIDDAERQIEAMDDTRTLVDSWDDLPPATPYSSKFLTIEGFKIIRRELFLNVGLAIASVGVIVFLTVASPVTSILITINVAFCIVEILGFMFAFGIVIDSVSVINIVLAVGLSVDYSAHVGHCFMVKGGDDKNARALEALTDIGAAVLSGAISTFLAVVVLLFSSSYVFVTLSRQLALTVILGISHGLIFLPVLLAVFGPKPFSSASEHGDDDDDDVGKPDKIGETANNGSDNNGSDNENNSSNNNSEHDA